MAHGYLREYDEAPDRGDDRDRRPDDERERSWRAGARDPNFMLGGREPGRGRQTDRFREEDRQFRGTPGNERDARDYGRSEREQSSFRRGGDGERSPRNVSSHQDDHYRSWRDRQMEPSTATMRIIAANANGSSIRISTAGAAIAGSATIGRTRR